jgi:uncharacterized membrane protein YczE
VAALVIGALGVAVGDAGLLVVSWRTRTSLGGLTGVASVALVGLSAGPGWTGTTARDEVLGALVFLIVGLVLFGLGQAIDHLLAGSSEGDCPDAAPAP